MLVMESKKADYEVLNVGSGVPRSIKSIAEDLARLMGKKLQPDITKKYRKGDIRHCFADISKMKKLGFKPSLSFEDGMKELIEWSSSVKAEDKFDQAAKELKSKGLI